MTTQHEDVGMEATVHCRVRKMSATERMIARPCGFCSPHDQAEPTHVVEVGHPENFTGPTERFGASVNACSPCANEFVGRR